MGEYIAQDWPDGVSAPGTDDWEKTASAWLLELIPHYRGDELLRRHPVVLASIARHELTGAVGGARDGYRVLRTELAEWASPPVLDAALAACRARGHDLAATVRAVTVVERALRGERPAADGSWRRLRARSGAAEDHHG